MKESAFIYWELCKITVKMIIIVYNHIPSWVPWDWTEEYQQAALREIRHSTSDPPECFSNMSSKHSKHNHNKCQTSF